MSPLAFHIVSPCSNTVCQKKKMIRRQKIRYRLSGAPQGPWPVLDFHQTQATTTLASPCQNITILLSLMTAYPNTPGPPESSNRKLESHEENTPETPLAIRKRITALHRTQGPTRHASVKVPPEIKDATWKNPWNFGYFSKEVYQKNRLETLKNNNKLCTMGATNPYACSP